MVREVLSRYARGNYHDVFWALLAANTVSIVLFVSRVVAAGNVRYWFLLWNLLLGWMPLLLAWRLSAFLRAGRWLTLVGLVLSGLWLAFLPNSFYLMSDLIHLHESGEVSMLFDAVMMLSFIFNALVLGFMSVFIVHAELLKRLRRIYAHSIVSGVFLLCGLAIYLGRYLRWNTWDVVLNPAGILFDISERVINPTSHPQILTTTVTFTLLLGAMYLVVWQFALALVGPKKKN